VSRQKQSLIILIIFGLLMGWRAAPAAAKMSLISETTQSFQRSISTLLDPAQLPEIPDSYELVGENDRFELYADPLTLAFKVMDKRNEYIWHSNLDEKLPEDRLNRTWTAFANSGISIDYFDQRINVQRASITNADHTIDYQKIDQGFEAVLTFTEPAISLTVKVTLNTNGVVVEIPSSSLKEENPAIRLATLHVYPFFGATRTDEVPGYFFIPDGSGSLIRFSAQTKAKNTFYGQYYGVDLGMLGALTFDRTVNRPFKISIPVIGMAHEDTENAYIAIVEKGASYGEFLAHPAGIITNFNFLYNTFIYNQSYFQATNRSGAGVTILQPKTNTFDVKIDYRFLAGAEADYVGMARSYRDFLIEQGELNKYIQSDENIGMRLEFLAGDKERILFWDRMIPMTTVEQMETILTDLGIQNPEVVYYGWQPLGASSMPPRSFKIDRKLGTKQQLIALSQKIQASGGHLYLYLDPQSTFQNESGYSTRSDLAMSITNMNITSFNRNQVNFFRNLKALRDYYTSISQDVFTELNAGFALDGIGTNLYSDHKKRNELTREEAIQQYQTLLSENRLNTAFYIPNHYLFRFMQAYFDIPITDSGYIYTSERVPFLQIAFSGYIPVYGAALNFSSNIQEDLLRHADFGVYPSFFLTQEVTANILETKSNWIFTSAYVQWEEEVKRTYQWLNDLLGPVKGQEIIARAKLAEGVNATTYSNGKMILVNYTDQPFVFGNITVNGRDAILSEAIP
jgi:hypothetical protein